MLKSINIKQLFGRFDYELHFPSEGIMIITGPNGYGKSTILRMVEYFCSNDFDHLMEIVFSSFSLICDHNTICIEKKDDQFSINGDAFQNPVLLDDDEKRHLIRYLGHAIDLESILNDDGQVDLKSINLSIKADQAKSIANRFFNLVLLSSYKNDKKVDRVTQEKVSNVKKQIDAVISEIGEVRFIKEQRLLERRVNGEGYRQEEKIITVIDENTRKLKASLADVMKQHSQLSSELDSSYVKRLVEADPKSILEITTIRDQLLELQQKQKKYQKYGLTESKTATLFFPNEDDIRKYENLLSIYIQDANAKYHVFEDTIRKLELYEEIVNQKLTFKRMELSSADGITVVSEEGKKLPLNTLSSGEQEILVLFYKLIFESDVKLLLIDEPEISLHIAWQKELLNNLKSILSLKPEMQVIIATHSPQIIANNWDLQIDLGEQYNG